MALTNMWTVEGNLAADVEVKSIDGLDSKVAEATIYVPFPRNSDESFRVDLSIWEGSSGWRVLDYLKKGSLVCAQGQLEPSPYVTSTSDEPRAGLQITVDRIDLKIVKDSDSSQAEESKSEPAGAAA